MRGIATFVFWTLLAALFCAGLFFAIAAIFFGLTPGGLFTAIGAGRTDAIIALLAFVFGTAATVAGAVATVYVSNLALRLAQDGERRETTRFVAERLDEAVEHITGIAASINELHAVAAQLLPDLDRFADGYSVPLHQLRENDHARLVAQHGPAGLFAADAIVRLAGSIEDAVRDDFTRFALARQTGAAAPSLPPEAYDAPFLLSELAAAPARLRLSALELRANPAWRLIEARLIADAAVSGGDDNKQTQEARPILFAGALIHSWSERAPGGSPHRLFVSGAAFLADLVNAAPNGEALISALKDKYPGVVPKKILFPAAFDPASALSPAIARSVQAARAIRALGYLQGPPPEP